MYSPIHATAGLLLAPVTPHPLLAFALGAASHYVLDRWPHGDTDIGAWFFAKPRRLWLVEVFDLGGAVLIVWWLVSRLPAVDPILLVAGAIGGIAPDVLWGTQYVSQSLRWLPTWVTRFLVWHQRWHERTHVKPANDVPLAAGLLFQATIIAVILLLYR